MAMETLGSGWRLLLDQLDGELRAVDPEAHLVRAVVDAHGLLQLRADFSPQAREAGRRLLREYEHRAAVTCELCGGAGRVYGGVVLLVRCESCA